MSEITHIREILPGIMAQAIKASERRGGMQYPYYRQLEEREVPQKIAESWFKHHADKGLPVAMTENAGSYQVWVCGEEAGDDPNSTEITGEIIKTANRFNEICRFDAMEAASG